MTTAPSHLIDLTRAVLEHADDDTFMDALRVDPAAAIQAKLGITLVTDDTLSDDELDGVVGGVAVSNVAIQSLNIQGMDLETAMMAVQSNRANLLETQLKDQIEGVQARNDQIAQLNNVLGELRKAEGADGQAGWSDHNPANKDHRAWDDAINNNPDLFKALKDNGFDVTNSKTDDKTNWGDGMEQKIKDKIDSLSSSQQMDMLRLQSLSNKRNEAFEIMTNFMKKMADNRSSIVGNMR